MEFLKHKLIDYTQDQHNYIQTMFNEFKECGPHFMSFISSKDNETFYISNIKNWERVFIEENFLEKDALNFIEETTSPRKWICWNNLASKYDPYGNIARRIQVCQTVKSASFIIPVGDRLNTFNFAFDHDLDIEKFIWENELLIENYTLGVSKILFQSGHK